jgi:hypothetical protein
MAVTGGRELRVYRPDFLCMAPAWVGAFASEAWGAASLLSLLLSESAILACC